MNVHVSIHVDLDGIGGEDHVALPPRGLAGPRRGVRGAARLDGEAPREDGLGRARRAVGREACHRNALAQGARGAPHVEPFQKEPSADRLPTSVTECSQRQPLRDAHVEPPQGKFRGL